ncbi:MAG: triose-phosphate isomerase [Candidatus Aminicenantes bacterium]|nr:triose-phosphate isomerase [Candidatus Aminicenantes bacterium]NIM79219.1 triose-phosphate isomerase [Candidatus Aminicenantes bacterium]NIN18497.1 triose-phosphate isomerase [Candidatus Aminicenantes bacterium]NIN42393.1 triose-phosphate isomerase [Candidatus Aminicenantes bacterium]NIN85160.1 triose-phosphate isomerase [Candidatus Aminicenantes bacterium]
MEKEYIIAGNWKMFKTVEESVDFLKALNEKINTLPQDDAVEILVFPPFTSLYAVKGISSRIKTGAQNLHFEENGAFTGEISPLMLGNLVDYVLIGHSERREIFKEKDEDINKKVKTALKHGFTPVLCIGESLEEREAGKTFSKVEDQLGKDLEGLNLVEIEKVVIAYEPIWAIGTGKNATPEQAQEVHEFIREILQKKIGSPETTRILYGGSVKPANSYDLLRQKDINGVLVGGASLKVDDFFGIIQDSYKLANG